MSPSVNGSSAGSDGMPGHADGELSERGGGRVESVGDRHELRSSEILSPVMISPQRPSSERSKKPAPLTDPGLQLVHHWRPDSTAEGLSDAEVSVYGGVARE